jgi:plasmid replication initiation protein
MIEDTTTPAKTDKPRPALKLKFLSHGTLESRDLAFSRKFYEEFLGLDVVQTSPISLLDRMICGRASRCETDWLAAAVRESRGRVPTGHWQLDSR